MKRFIRMIENDILCVCVDETVFERFNNIISVILRTYTPMYNEIASPMWNYFYIITETKKHYYPNEQTYVIYEDDKNWLLGLINDLDVFHTEILKSTVIHGSCVKVQDKSILIIGERWSGKTTLTHFLMSFLNGEYLSDDCVYFKNKRYLGFCMPLPMRNYNELKTEINHKDIALTDVIDSDGFERTLIVPTKTIECIDKMNYILFPKYTTNTEGAIKPVGTVELFKKIINNVRFYTNIKEMYTDITEIIENTPAYNLQYSSSNMAHRLLQDNNII